jgi:hypothetical protein
MPLTVPRSALKPIYDWRIERSLYGRETIKYGPVYAYYADLIAFKLQASTPILVKVRGENCGVLLREISKNFTGTGNAGIRIALPSNDAYLVTLSNPSPSPASVSGGRYWWVEWSKSKPLTFTTLITPNIVQGQSMDRFTP